MAANIQNLLNRIPSDIFDVLDLFHLKGTIFKMMMGNILCGDKIRLFLQLPHIVF